MSKEQTIKQLAEYLQASYGSVFANLDFKKLRKDRRDNWLQRAGSLIDVIESLGYRYIPELNVLSDEEKLACSLISKYPYSVYNIPKVRDIIDEVCLHQLDSIKRQLEGK